MFRIGLILLELMSVELSFGILSWKDIAALFYITFPF